MKNYPAYRAVIDLVGEGKVALSITEQILTDRF